MWKNEGKSCLLFCTWSGFIHKRPYITWPLTWALFLPLIPAAPWILLHLFVLWSTHNRCFVGVSMLKAARKNGTFVKLNMTIVLANWWSAESHLSKCQGPHLMDGLTVWATHPTADAWTQVPLGSQAVILPTRTLPPLRDHCWACRNKESRLSVFYWPGN